MVNISQKDFNKSMDMYIGSRKSYQNKLAISVKGSISKAATRMRGTLGYSIPTNLSEHKIHIEEKNPSLFKRLFGKKTKQEKKEILDEINSEPEEIKEKIQGIADEYDTLQEVEDDIEQKKEGLFKKLANLLKTQPKEQKDIPVEKINQLIGKDPDKAINIENDKLIQAIDDLKSDIKIVSKIAYVVMDQLPSEEQKNFKNTKYFYDYKEILKKYGLIK